MNYRRGIAFILGAIFLVLYAVMQTYVSAHSIGLLTIEFLAMVVAPILCVIGFILAMLKN